MQRSRLAGAPALGAVTLFQVSLNFSAIWRCEPVPNGNWPKHFSFYFQPLSRTFSVPNSVCPEIFRWPVFSVKRCSWQESNPWPLEQNYPALPTAPCQLIMKPWKKSKLWKKSGIFAELNLKWKVPAHFPNYFNVQKGVQEKYLHMVVKINPV